jgi:uncharacterized membrane protein
MCFALIELTLDKLPKTPARTEPSGLIVVVSRLRQEGRRRGGYRNRRRYGGSSLSIRTAAGLFGTY